jgi:hypothetical protein
MALQHNTLHIPRPGDLITWVYKVDESGTKGIPVDDDENLWSGNMRRWVLIGGVHLLIAVTYHTFSGIDIVRWTWLPLSEQDRNPVSAHSGDMSTLHNTWATYGVTPTLHTQGR